MVIPEPVLKRRESVNNPSHSSAGYCYYPELMVAAQPFKSEEHPTTTTTTIQLYDDENLYNDVDDDKKSIPCTYNIQILYTFQVLIATPPLNCYLPSELIRSTTSISTTCLYSQSPLGSLRLARFQTSLEDFFLFFFFFHFFIFPVL